MPGVKIHLEFDKILKDKKIIRHEVETRQIHDYMDKNLKKYGGRTHRLEDPRHQPELIRAKINNGKSLKTGDSLIDSVMNHFSARFRDPKEKTYLLRVAYGHRIVDEIDAQRDWKNIDTFYTKCLKEYKFKNWHLKKIS